MTLTTGDITDLYKASRSDAWILLARIEHVEMKQDILVARNTVDVIHQSETYLKCSFDVALPTDSDALPQARIMVQNVDREIGRAILGIRDAVEITLTIVRSSDLNTVVHTWPKMKLRDVSGDASFIEGVLYVETFDTEPYPGVRASKELAPGLFR